MRARIEDRILFIHRDDVPPYVKGGSTVRNSYFWALKAIAGAARRERDWEFEAEIWLALQRLLLSFGSSGYLATSETTLEFLPQADIPDLLRSVAMWGN
ncbi:MAG: hypothetical protein AAFY57_19050 [Cyanobacteria bacterium J06642_2]